MLLSIFEEINRKYFDGFLEPPVLRWNGRLRTSAGRFYSGSRKFFSQKPPVIEIASYLLKEPEGHVLVKDTLAHEMIHYWLWVRKRPYGHNAEFLQKMKVMGVSRYNPAPKFRPFRYLYLCATCRREFPARRRLSALACASCCKQYGNGRYDSRFKLVEAKALS